MTLHCMLDLETWSTEPNATIISVGAVKFDPFDPNVPFDAFHVAVDPRAWSPLPGLHPVFDISADTLIWWMDPSRTEPRERWLAAQKLDLPTVLSGFVEWFGGDSLPVWGNASTFDNVILRHAFKACGIPCPWKFWDDRCYRTEKNRRESAGLKRLSLPSDASVAMVLGGDAGMPHDALFDAARQALHLQILYASDALSKLPEPTALNRRDHNDTHGQDGRGGTEPIDDTDGIADASIDDTDF